MLWIPTVSFSLPSSVVPDVLVDEILIFKVILRKYTKIDQIWGPVGLKYPMDSRPCPYTESQVCVLLENIEKTLIVLVL